MGINIRQKGANGEREICQILNNILVEVLKERGYSQEILDKVATQVQRNQNQTAVGGCDLVGTFQLAIEIKRQEALAVNTWWRQCTASADHLGAIPVLLYRQNRGKWNCVMPGAILLPSGREVMARVEVSFESFLVYFKELAIENLEK